jgi:uncharacterized protein (DUF2141 family)
LVIVGARTYEPGSARAEPHSLASAAQASSALNITIGGLRKTSGTILIGLYDSKASFERAIELAGDAGFLNDPQRVAGAALRANDRLDAGIRFENLAPGRYAVILFHDENANGKLDKNFFGVPTEPYGFSNDAEGLLGPPGFEAAALTLNGRDRSIKIDLVYHEGGFLSAPPDAPAASASKAPATLRSALPAGDPDHF